MSETLRMVDIVFDGPPSHESGRFVEVEDASGKSISIGNWVQRPDGYWVLRIGDPRELAAALKAKDELGRKLFLHENGAFAHAVERAERAEKAKEEAEADVEQLKQSISLALTQITLAHKYPAGVVIETLKAAIDEAMKP